MAHIKSADAALIHCNISRSPIGHAEAFWLRLAALCGCLTDAVLLCRAVAALLYLVPSCIIIPSAVAAARGEFSELYKYSEEVEEEVYEEGEFLDYDGEVLDDYEEETFGDEDFLFLLDGES